MTRLSPGKALRVAADASFLRIPGAPNALAGRMIERLGFDAIYLSGAAFSAGVLALPDVGLFTLTELAQQTAYLTRRVSLPVVVDADTGFGEALSVERTVIELEAAGAAAIQLEDQQLPKRCGHLAGKSLVSAEAMCAKIAAAAAAKNDDDFVIIARTDARGVTDFDDAVRRANMYLDAGADWIFPEALLSRDEFQRFADAVDAPLIANMTEYGKSPLLPVDELEAAGFAGVLYPVTALRLAMKAIETGLSLLARDGIQTELIDLEVMQTREELYELLDYNDFEERDREYFRTHLPKD